MATETFTIAYSPAGAAGLTMTRDTVAQTFSYTWAGTTFTHAATLKNIIAVADCCIRALPLTDAHLTSEIGATLD